MVLVNFWRYPDPYKRFLIRIRIRNAEYKSTLFLIYSMRYEDIKIDKNTVFIFKWIRNVPVASFEIYPSM